MSSENAAQQESSQVTKRAGPPTAEMRKTCWSARDKYFNCRIAYTTEDKRVKNCAELQKVFAGACPKSWVKHFFQKQNWEEYKRELAKQNQMQHSGE